MKLAVDIALQMLENARGKTLDDNWIDHSICVGNSAEKIVESLGLDTDYAKTLGYIHDIGKAVGEFSNHIINGYKYLKELEYDDEYANICLTHSYLNNDVKHEYTIYEKIINLCDLMCKKEVMTIDKRLVDIIIRRGVYENTQYHVKETYKLKEYIDEKLGFNVYNLFPNIII